MCYHISQKRKGKETLKNVFGMDDIRMDSVPSYYHLNGYDRGQVMLITQREPEVIQLATWSIAPPNSEDISGYWKKVGGGALNTRIESLFETKTPFWKQEAILEQKCIVIVDGMFKVFTASDGTKIPMYVKRPDDSLFGVLGFYTKQDEDLTCSLFTTDADDFFKQFHKRMPFTLEPEDTDYYLGLNSEDDFKREIESHRASGLQYYPVNSDVINSHVTSNRNDIIQKVDYDALNTLF